MFDAILSDDSRTGEPNAFSDLPVRSLTSSARARRSKKSKKRISASDRGLLPQGPGAFRPFHDVRVTTRLAGILQAVLEEIDILDDVSVRDGSPAALKRHFVSLARPQPLVLHTARLRLVGDTTTSHVEVVVPFTGDPAFWRAIPTGCPPTGCPEIVLRGGAVAFRCPVSPAPADARLEATAEECLRALAAGVDAVARDIRRHNAAAFRAVCLALQRRRTRTRASTGTAQERTVAERPFPRWRQRSVIDHRAPPRLGRRRSLGEPAQSRGTKCGEFVLCERDFDRMLQIVRAIAATLAGSPAAARVIDVEIVRAFLVAQLNAYYEWADGSEVFSPSGTNDIAIVARRRVAFIMRVCFWERREGGGKRSVVDRFVADVLSRAACNRAKGVLLLFHAAAEQRAARDALHEAFFHHRECRCRLMREDNGETRSAFDLPNRSSGVIVLHALPMSLAAD